MSDRSEWMGRELRGLVALAVPVVTSPAAALPARARQVSAAVPLVTHCLSRLLREIEGVAAGEAPPTL